MTKPKAPPKQVETSDPIAATATTEAQDSRPISVDSFRHDTALTPAPDLRPQNKGVMMKQLPLGKKPARENAYSFKLVKYVGADLSALPIAPAVFGYGLDILGWDMLGNDKYGDCVWAGAGHETILWVDEAGGTVEFSDKSVLSDYSAVTGFTPNNPNSDQGTDMEEAAKYRRKTGVLDADGKRHTVDAYLELPGVSARGKNDPTKLLPALATSAYVFGGVGLGIQFPDSAMKQFNSNQPWSVVKGSSIEGGHYVPIIGRRANGNFVVVTWGALQEVTPEFITAYADEAVVYISLERLKDGKTLQGFDVTTLQADLAALGGSVAPTPVPTPTPTPNPTPTPSPVPTPTDGNIATLDIWAGKKHTGANSKAAKAWIAVKSAHQL